MYSLITPASRQRLAIDQFVGYYRELHEKAEVRHVQTSVVSSLASGDHAQVACQVTLVTERLGLIDEKKTVDFTYHDSRWLLEWQPSLLLDAFGYGCSFAVETTDNPRGFIYDRAGRPMANLSTRVVVGVVPAYIEDEDTLLKVLASVFAEHEEAIRARYSGAVRPDWFMAVGELSSEQAQEHYSQLTSVAGILLRERPIRFYPEGQVAAHITGYVSVITSEQLSELQDESWRRDDLVGQVGLEKYFEKELAGRRGVRLIVMAPDGSPRAIAAEKPAEPSKAVYSTIDLPLQRLSFSLLEGKRGAVVALNPHNGEVLVLASSPSYDPNTIIAGLTPEQWNALLEDEGQPLVNRATQSELPPGSVFKIVTEAAALETGLFTPESPFYCSGTWTGLGQGWVKHCWKRSGHGSLDLATGLSVSCDVVFYELGKALHEHDREVLPQFAKAFGFGARTGIVGVSESPGLVPTPTWKDRAIGESWFPGDSVNLAIGQGYLLVTPLQVANMLAAIANGGTLYKPRLVSRIGPEAASETTLTSEPEVLGTLPLNPDHLQSIRKSLRDVAMSPIGTTYHVLGDMPIPVAGKSGTAENPGEKPHAWFAGYAPADDPEIAIAVVVEHGGEGSPVAAPIFRRIVEAFFAAKAQHQ